MDKKQLMVIEKYTQPFVQLVFEKGEQDLVFEKLTQIKGIFEETGLANFLAHIGVEDEEKAKSLRLFQPSDSQLRKKIWDSSSLDPTKDRSRFNWWLCRDSQS